MLTLAAMEDDHFGNEVLLVRREASEDCADVVGGGGGLVGGEELEEAEAGLPPFCWEGVVGDELVVGWFGGFEDTVCFVGLGER